MILNNTDNYRKKYNSHSKLLINHQKLLDNNYEKLTLQQNNSKSIAQANSIKLKSNKISKVELKMSQYKQSIRQKNITSFKFQSAQQTTLTSFGTKQLKYQQPSTALKTQKSKIVFMELEVTSEKQQQLIDYSELFKDKTQNSLFFCSDCMRYLFIIQKKFHYPICQNKISAAHLQIQQKLNNGVILLDLIHTMSIYTQCKEKQVRSLYKQMLDSSLKTDDFQQNHKNLMKNKRKYLSSDEVLLAMHYIYQQLIKDAPSHKLCNLKQIIC